MPIQGRFEGGSLCAQSLALSLQSSHVDRQSVTIDIQGDPLTGSI
jgi:cytochrome c oxidase subunit IV